MGRVYYYHDLGFRDSCVAAIEPVASLSERVCVFDCAQVPQSECVCVLLRVIGAENNTPESYRGGLIILLRRERDTCSFSQLFTHISHTCMYTRAHTHTRCYI